MNPIRDSADTSTHEPAVELRVFRIMIATVAIGLIGALIATSWRVTAGVALGGTLSLLNYHWLRTSVTALLNEATAKRPSVTITRYVLRYFVIGAAVFALYTLNMISLPATIAGLCAFVPALLVEAFRQFCFAIIHREGTH